VNFADTRETNVSPEAMNRVEKSDLRLIVESFYDALRARDVQAIEDLVDEHFADGAALLRPESLPGGGVTAGAETIKRFMSAAATMEGGPLDVSQMVVAEILEHAGEDCDHVVAEVRFPLGAGATTALEWWTLRDLKVIEIKAYYWDTAAMVAGASGPGRPSGT
jgi:hypothetical protein